METNARRYELATPHRKMSILNPYRFAGGGGGSPTVYVEQDFTATTTGDLSGTAPSTDELGGGWLGNTTRFDFQGDSSGVAVTTTNESTAVVQTNGREDVEIITRLIATRGSSNARWNGITLRGTGTATADGLQLRFHDAATVCDLRLLDAGTTLNTWDLSVLLTNAPQDGDWVKLTMRCSGNSIIFYKIQIDNGTLQAEETPNNSYTLTGATATTHGSGSGADYYGLYSNERAASSGERWEDFLVQSIV